VRAGPENGADNQTEMLGPSNGFRRNDDGFLPIHSFQARQKPLAHTAFKVIDTELPRVETRYDQVAREFIPVKRSRATSRGCFAVGTAHRDALRSATQ